jgi:ribosomal-protein-alanine N-acetyltransferase
MRKASQPLKAKNGQIVICPDEIEGFRLMLKPIAAEYANEIFKEFTPEITTYMFPRSPSHISETEQFIADACKQREDGTDLVFVILDKPNSEFLGVCGLHRTQNAREPEFGIWLKKTAHKRALGREAIGVLKAWCERTLSIDGFVYPVDRRNQPSRKIPEALGGKVVSEKKVQTMSGTELDELIYRIPLSPAADNKSFEMTPDRMALIILPPRLT